MREKLGFKNKGLRYKLALVILAGAGLFFVFSDKNEQAVASGDDFTLAGYAWNSVGAGWISFSCENNEVCDTSNYGVNIRASDGLMYGYAWSANYGWLSFNNGAMGGSNDLTGCPSGSCTARYDASNNLFVGWAKFLALEDDGWVKLSGNVTSGGTYGVRVNLTSSQLEGYAWGHDLIGWISFNCSNQGVCEDANYFVYGDFNFLTSPDVYAESDPPLDMCERVRVVITDKSTTETDFIIYRGTSDNFSDPSTEEVAMIASIDTPGTGAENEYIDLVPYQPYFSGGQANLYYFARAYRGSDNQASDPPGVSNQVTVVECPPEIVPHIFIHSVTRNGETFPYTPTTRLHNGDTLTIHLAGTNVRNATAENLSTVSTLTSNLTNVANVQGSVDGSPFVSVPYSYSDNTLTIGGLGSLGGQSSGTLRFNVDIDSQQDEESMYDRLNISGVMSWTYQGDNYSRNYNLNFVPIYLQLPGPVQFRERAP